MVTSRVALLALLVALGRTAPAGTQIRSQDDNTIRGGTMSLAIDSPKATASGNGVDQSLGISGSRLTLFPEQGGAVAITAGTDGNTAKGVAKTESTGKAATQEPKAVPKTTLRPTVTGLGGPAKTPVVSGPNAGAEDDGDDGDDDNGKVEADEDDGDEDEGDDDGDDGDDGDNDEDDGQGDGGDDEGEDGGDDGNDGGDQ